MNQEFLFNVTLWHPKYPATMQTHVYGASGSQETRARRRLLEAFHNDGIMVKSMILLASRPANKKEG